MPRSIRKDPSPSIPRTMPGHVGGVGKSTTIEHSRTADPKKRNVTTTTTRSNEHASTTSTSTTHTSRKGRESTKNSETQGGVEDAGVLREGSMVLAETQRNFVQKGDTEHRTAPKKIAGGVEVDAYYQGPSFNMDGEASISKRGFGVDIDVNLKIDANLIKGGANATKEFTFKVNGEEVKVKVKLGAEGQVGINGELKLKVHVGKDGVSITAGADGFAGAKGTLSGALSVEVNGRESAAGEIRVTAAAGAMAGAEFEAGLNHFRAKAYAAVGVGVGIEIMGKVNAGNVVRAAGGLALPGHQGW